MLSLDSEKRSLSQVQEMVLKDKQMSSSLCNEFIFNDMLLKDHEEGK